MGSFLPRGALVALFVAVPWLNPVALGPSPGVQPWLASMACSVSMRKGFDRYPSARTLKAWRGAD